MNARTERHFALDSESACTGSCVRGRHCDCVPDVPAPKVDNQPSRRSWRFNDAVIAALLACVLAAVLFGVL